MYVKLLFLNLLICGTVNEEQRSTIVIITLVVVLALLLYWTWLTSLELFVAGIVALTVGLYFALMHAIGLRERERIMQEELRQEERRLKKQLCVSPN
jgi:uncharacterized protein YqfA (UPF0365 family)